jgi:hypothetical protein
VTCSNINQQYEFCYFDGSGNWTCTCVAQCPKSPPADIPSQRARGRVYDIDYSKGSGWVQILVAAAPTESLVTVTSNPRLQSIAQLSLILQQDLDVEYVPGPSGQVNTLRSARVTVPPPIQPNHVSELSFDDSTHLCTVMITGHPGRLTASLQAQGILEVAIIHKLEVQYLRTDPTTNEITRVKINTSSPP